MIKLLDLLKEAVEVPTWLAGKLEDVHTKPGQGSIFAKSIADVLKIAQDALDKEQNIDKIANSTGTLTIKSPGIGYNLVLPIEKAKALSDAKESEVEKVEGPNRIKVPAITTSAPLTQFKTDELTVIVRPKKDESGAIIPNEYIVLSAFPGDPTIPRASEWGGKYAVIIPGGNTKINEALQYFHNGADMNQIINYDDSDITDDLESFGQGSMDGQDFKPGETYNIGGQEYKVELQGDEFKLVLAENLKEKIKYRMQELAGLTEKMTPAQKKKRGEIYDTLVSQGMESEKAGRIATSKAMAEATFTDKYDDNPKLRGKQTKLPDELQAQLVKEGDHEVAMAVSSLESIAEAIVELRQKLGNVERNIPGWIQDHIAKAENYIEQAAQGFHELKHNEMNEQLKRLQELAGLIKEEQFYGDYTENQVRQMLIDAGKDEAEVDDFMNDEEGYFSWSNMVFDHEPSLEDIKNAFEDAFEEWATGGTNSLYDLDEAAKVRTEPQGGGRIELVITSKDKAEVEKEIEKIEREYPSAGYGTFVKKKPFQKGDTWVAVVRRGTTSGN